MKLIFCPKCEDVVKLQRPWRYCVCGKSKGRYLQDGLRAEIKGLAIPIGFTNGSFARALNKRQEEENLIIGVRFDAFIIPRNCETVKENA